MTLLSKALSFLKLEAVWFQNDKFCASLMVHRAISLQNQNSVSMSTKGSMWETVTGQDAAVQNIQVHKCLFIPEQSL
jgi:hypothetical protein